MFGRQWLRTLRNVRTLARVLLRLSGFRLVGVPPQLPQLVVVFAPHTSNWDFVIMVLVKFAYGARVSYLAKHTLFESPFGWLFRALGGIAVKRDRAHNMVEQVAEWFAKSEQLWLALAPEGTRAKTDHWKTGFYRIALRVRVPLLLTFIDTSRRECGICGLLELTGNPEIDLEALRNHYGAKRGIRPEQASDIRFKSGVR